MEIQPFYQSQSDKENAISSLLRELQPVSRNLLITYSIFNTTYPPDSIVSFLNFTIDEVLTFDPSLSKLSQLVISLRSLYYRIRDQHIHLHFNDLSQLKPLFRRQVLCYTIYRTVLDIDYEIKCRIDEENVKNLVRTLQGRDSMEEKEKVLRSFKERLSERFDIDLQQEVLREKVVGVLATVISDSNCLKKVRENAALAMEALVEYNKDVFAGLVMMSDIAEPLVSMASSCSMHVLSSLLRHVKTPLIDEIEQGELIPRIVLLLSPEAFVPRPTRAMSGLKIESLECIYQIAYYGKKEAIQTLFQVGLMEKLMLFERSVHRGDNVVELSEFDYSDDEIVKNNDKHGGMEGCVLRFAVTMDMNERLSVEEKKELKEEIKRRVRETSVCEAEAAYFIGELLWGSSTF